MLYETRAILEPYAARLACARRTGALGRDGGVPRRVAERPGVTPAELIDVDRECHEIIWAAAEQPVPHRHPRHAVRPERPAVAHVPRRRRRHVATPSTSTVRSSTPSSTATATAPPSSPPPTSARSTNRSATPSPAASAHPSPAPETPVRSVCFRLPVGASEADSSEGWGCFGVSRGGFGRVGSRSGP